MKRTIKIKMVSCRSRRVIYFFAFTFINSISFTLAYKITLDTQSDVIPGIWNLGNCIYLTYANDTNDGNTCLPTGYPEDIGDGRTGFWTTCLERKCVISFQLSQNGNYTNGPISMGISSYLTGRQSITITAHVGDSGDIVQNVGKIEDTGNQWNSTTFSLEKYDWTSNSRIEFATNWIPDKIDLIDKIEIEFPDVPTTIMPTSDSSIPTSTEYSTTSTPATSVATTTDEPDSSTYKISSPTTIIPTSDSSIGISTEYSTTSTLTTTAATTTADTSESSTNEITSTPGPGTSENPETTTHRPTRTTTTTRTPRPTRTTSRPPTLPPENDDDSDTVKALSIAVYSMSLALVSLVSCMIGAFLYSRYRRRK